MKRLLIFLSTILIVILCVFLSFKEKSINLDKIDLINSKDALIEKEFDDKYKISIKENTNTKLEKEIKELSRKTTYLLLGDFKETSEEYYERHKNFIKLRYSSDDEIDSLENQKKELEEKLKVLNETRDAVYLDLLKDAKAENLKDEKVNDLFVTYFSKEDVTWLDDEGLLAALKQNGAKQFIKVVTTTKESIDKKELKKAFKTDASLKESYKQFYGTKLTEYVTVTTEENHKKMLEHIEEGSKNVK